MLAPSHCARSISCPRLPARGLALALLGLCACTEPPAGSVEGPLRVVERVTSAGIAGGEQRAEPLKLGTHTRQALPVGPGQSLHLERPSSARALLFSVAATAGAVRLRIDAEVDGERITVFEEALDETDRWHDRRLEAAALPTGAQRLRLAVAPDTPGAQAYFGSLLWLGPARETSSTPNLVLLSLDTLSADYLGAFGGPPGVSPRIDAFLEQSFSLRRAYAQYGNTLVSHISLFSGLLPRHHGRYPDTALRPFASLVSALADAGYRTAAFTEGAFVASNWGFAQGYDAYDDGIRGLHQQMAGGAERTFERARRWLAESRDQRFFLFVHTYEVHSPYVWRSPEEAEWIRGLTDGELRAIAPKVQAEVSRRHNEGRARLRPRELELLRALHLGEIRRLDGIVGAFLDELEALDLAGDTLVVLLSDHGDQFGEAGKVGHGESLHNRVLHVPLAFRWPGHVEPGSSEQPVQLVDVLPTLLELAGLPRPDGLDGVSLAPLLRGRALHERPAFSEQRSAPGECTQLAGSPDCLLGRYAVQTRRYKLISSELPPYERLVDLREDPEEAGDVAEREPAELARHRALLRAYLDSPSPLGDPDPPPALDRQTLEQLEALGYRQ